MKDEGEKKEEEGAPDNGPKQEKKKPKVVKKVKRKSTLLKRRETYSCIAQNYKTIKFLGKGAFGEVVLATHSITGEKRAIKKIKIPKFNSQKEKDKIMKEIQFITKLDHPNIVRLYEFYADFEFYYLITEFC